MTSAQGFIIFIVLSIEIFLVISMLGDIREQLKEINEKLAQTEPPKQASGGEKFGGGT